MLSRFNTQLRYFDWPLFVSVFLFGIFGLAAMWSIALAEERGDYSSFIKQAVYFGLSVAVFFIFSLTNYAFWRNSARLFYFIGLALLAAVLVFGVYRRGTTGWFAFYNFTFQPVEFMKIALLAALARVLARHEGGPATLRLIGRSALTVGVPAVLVFVQPDFGSAALLFLLWAGLIAVIGIERRRIIIFLTIFALITVLSWTFIFKDYQRDRFLTLVQPAADPLKSGYNVTQSIIAIGSGQLFGRGLGFGSQSQLKFLPESRTDFIFAVIAEELGFAAGVALFFFFALFFWRAFRILKVSRDNFALFLCLGVIVLVAVETIINIGMNIGLLPVTGITLPFLSYGGSSLLAHFAIAGFLESVAISGRAIDDNVG